MKTKVYAIAAVILTALFLTGCESITGALEPVRIYAGKGAATAMIGECALPGNQRLANLNSVNAALMEAGSSARAAPLDCDGDGKPDLIEAE